MTDEEGAAELLETARETAQVGKRLGVARLNLHGTGLGVGGLPVTPCETVSGAMWLKARDTLCRVADMAEDEGVVYTLENLNLPVDHPGVPFGRAEDTLALVSAVNRPQLRINLDLYHTQIGEGDLVRWCEKSLPWIGEVQVADNPGRCEPGSGEINYNGVAKALKAMGYSGPVATGMRRGKDGQVRPFSESMDYQTYAEHVAPGFLREGFFEREIHSVTHRFGNIAHVLSTYETRKTADGPVIGRGVNSFQLSFDGTRWWITSLAWDSERPKNPIPKELLP